MGVGGGVMDGLFDYFYMIYGWDMSYRIILFVCLLRCVMYVFDFKIDIKSKYCLLFIIHIYMVLKSIINMLLSNWCFSGEREIKRILPKTQLTTTSWVSNTTDHMSSLVSGSQTSVTIINNPTYYNLMKLIRNGEPLTSDDLAFIYTLPSENLIEIIQIYNINMQNIKDLL